jgi:hypothetical protein
MDDTLKAKVAAAGKDGQVIRFTNPDAGEIDLIPRQGAEAGERYTLKTMPDLYGAGTGKDAVDLRDDEFLSLLMSIEEAIVDYDGPRRQLTDGMVLMALDRLSMTPEANVAGDPLAVSIQAGIRLTLSLNDFSRADVKHALRKIKQSFNRHNRLAGTRGYLSFIRAQLRR